MKRIHSQCLNKPTFETLYQQILHNSHEWYLGTTEEAICPALMYVCHN